MARHNGTETDFELTTLERLHLQGYGHQVGFKLARNPEEVVQVDVLRSWLARRYPELPAAALEEAVKQISRPEGVDTIRRNLAFHQLLTRGFELKVEFADGRQEHLHLYPVNWDEPLENDFVAVNQLPVSGRNDRRPDIVIYINGLPLVIFELKNPYAVKPTVAEAFNQIQHYTHEIPQLFDFNALVVISDGTDTQHGMWTASEEWYAPWKSIDGVNNEPTTIGSMKTLIEGLFAKERLLHYIRHFILFEVEDEKISKKGAKYHQFFAVQVAVQKTLETYRRQRTSGGEPAERRVGVIWHTTGSGKSLSMVFLVGLLRRQPELENPAFVIQVDRTDLDDQLHDQFVAARALVGEVKHAEYAEELADLLQTEGGEVVLTTLQKFGVKRNEGEQKPRKLSDRANVIVIADEAHRSQYGFEAGFARLLNDAFPRALRLGFTGTPVSLQGANTVQVFGEVIHTYDIEQAQRDRATVPIYYAPRQVKLQLTRQDVDTALGEIAEGQTFQNLEKHKSRWAELARVTGVPERMAVLTRDLLAHFLERTATLQGKAMIVCMTRTNCVSLYNALTALPDCPEVKIIMTGNLGEDPQEWSQAGHLTTKRQRELLKKRMIDPDDPLKIVIVCDMWLTGTDIPCLHTLYVDKPMEGHNMIQAISRVNRVFRDKSHGLIVDYIGIGEQLREATSQYTQSGGKGEPAPNIEESARPLFQASRAEVFGLLPANQPYGNWRGLSRIALEDLHALVYGHLTASEERRDQFLQAETRLTHAFLLVKHLDDCRGYADEVLFCQRVRNEILKTIPGVRPPRAVERAVRDLVDESIDSEGVVDIFQVVGIDKPDISILDDNFLQTFRDRKQENLQLILLERLLQDELQRRKTRNLARARSFQELLEKTLRNYHNRLIDAAAVVQQMIEIRREMEADDQRAHALGLSDEELAFYDAVAGNYLALYSEEFLRDLIHEVVQTLKRNLKVDWTAEHRDDIQAAVRAAVKRTLTRRGVRKEDLEPFLGYILTQAEALYVDWPVVGLG